MDLLTISQIIFNLTASVAIAVVGTLLVIIASDIIKSINRIKKICNDFSVKSAELYRQVDSFLSVISSLPLISRLFEKRKSKK